MMKRGLRLVCVAAWMDEAVPLHSALFYACHENPVTNPSLYVPRKSQCEVCSHSRLDATADMEHGAAQRLPRSLSVVDDDHGTTLIVEEAAPSEEKKQDANNVGSSTSAPPGCTCIPLALPGREGSPNLARAIYIAPIHFEEDFLFKLIR